MASRSISDTVFGTVTPTYCSAPSGLPTNRAASRHYRNEARAYNPSNFLPDAKALNAYYNALSDQELLKLRAEGGLTAEAERTVDKELVIRNLTADEAKRSYAPEWLEKADVGTVGVIVLEDGEQITAEVVGQNEDSDRLSVAVISPDDLPRSGRRRNNRAIPLHQILSFEPQLHLMERWPFSDPCRGRTFSLPRLALMTMIFLCWTAGSIPLFLLVSKPYGLQVASIINYTLFEVFFTFARTGGGPGGRDLPPFKFTCPAVKPKLRRLLWHHFGFLAGLFALQTAMLVARTHLPDWWNTQDRKGSTPFDIALLFLCFGLAWVQVRSNRSLLDRAHREFSA